MRPKLRRTIRRPLLLVWDRLNVHRSTAKSLDPTAIHVEWLPPYAPDLNPVEGVWNHSKYVRLANYIPDDAFALHCAAAVSLAELRADRARLQALFTHAELFL